MYIITKYIYSKQGLATKSWHLYFSSSLMVLGGIDTTPLQSLLSKIVEPSEFGYKLTFWLFLFQICTCRNL